MQLVDFSFLFHTCAPCGPLFFWRAGSTRLDSTRLDSNVGQPAIMSKLRSMMKQLGFPFPRGMFQSCIEKSWAAFSAPALRFSVALLTLFFGTGGRPMRDGMYRRKKVKHGISSRRGFYFLLVGLDMCTTLAPGRGGATENANCCYAVRNTVLLAMREMALYRRWDIIVFNLATLMMRHEILPLQPHCLC